MNKLMFLLFFIHSFSYSQWSWLNPQPQGNQLYQIMRLSNGSILSVGRAGTILLTTNNGIFWNIKHRVQDTTSEITTLFRLNDNFLIAGSWDGYILKSTDQGVNWSKISKVNIYPGLKKLFFTDVNTGYGLYNDRIYKSSNGGINWALASSLPLNTGDVFFINNNTGFAAGGQITDVTWFMKTTNGGFNWTNSNVYPDVGPIGKVYFLNENTGYISTYGQIYKTTNSGVNWLSLNLPAGVGFVNDFHFFNEQTCYAGTANPNFLKTTNGGINWTTGIIGEYTFNSNSGINSLSFSSESIGAVLLHNHMVFLTSNGGENWVKLTNSMNPYTPLKSIEFLDNNNILLGGWGTSNDFIIRKSTNGGINWNGIVAYDYQISTGVIYDIDFPSASTGYAVGGGSKGYVYKSINAGNNWVKLDSMGTGANHVVNFLDNNTGFVLGYNGEIFRTSNGGLNWTTYNSGVSFRLHSIFFVNSLTGYTCGGNATQKLLKTTDAGLTWNQTYTTTGSSFNNIFFLNQNTGFIAAKGVLKTTDEGVTWIQKVNGQQPSFHKIFFPVNNIGYAFAAFGRFFKTTDSGESWGELFVPTDNSISDLHFLDENIGYLIGDQGMILKTTNGGGNFYLGINTGNNSLPDHYELYQNFPNPFNPFTFFKFKIPQNTFVQIRIFDIMGREILNLVNEYKMKGEYEVGWDASNYPSGVYFYEMQAGDFKQSKKMVLVK